MADELARRNHTTATGAVRDALRSALADGPITRDEPLLFKGEDFTHTDVRPAL